MCCLKDKSISTKLQACYVSSYLLVQSILSEPEIMQQLFEFLKLQVGSESKPTLVLESVLIILLMRPREEDVSKKIEFLMAEYIMPQIQAASNLILDTFEETNVDEQDEYLKEFEANKLDSYLMCWQVSVSFIRQNKLESILKDSLIYIIELLEYNNAHVRISAAKSILVIIDLMERREFNFDSLIDAAIRKLDRIIYVDNFEWPNSTSQKIFETICESIKQKETLVTVNSITLSNQPSKSSKLNHNEILQYRLNYNHKGHPLTGVSDATVVQFIHDYFGSSFSNFLDFSSLTSNLFTDSIVDIISRHPSSHNFTIQAEQYRSFGKLNLKKNYKSLKLVPKASKNDQIF